MPRRTDTEPTRSVAVRKSDVDGVSLRDRILAAVERMVGNDYKLPRLSVSLREIAREVGTAAPSIYRHFPDKEDLVLAALDIGFAEMFEAEVTAAASVADPFDSLRAMGHAYCAYLIGRPGLARLMFAANPMLWRLDGDTPDYYAAQQELWRSAISKCVNAGYAVDSAVEASAHQIWALLQGHVVLALTSVAEQDRKAQSLAEWVDLSFDRLGQLWPRERS